MGEGGIWVWVEELGGRIRQGSKEALSKARELADKMGRGLTALVPGKESQELISEMLGHPDLVLFLDGKETPGGASSEFLEALEDLCASRRPFVLMASWTQKAMDWMPCLAARLGRNLVTDAMEVEALDGDSIRVKRPVHGGRFLGVFEASGTGPHLICTRPRSFSVTHGQRIPEVEVISRRGVRQGGLEVIERKLQPSGKMDLIEAPVIVAGGRGLGRPEAFSLLEELASILGGAVGASRSVVDLGWRPASEQVGKSGKTVSPELYIAFGISGAIHHIMGMDTSRVIVAVNKDPNALIFRHADYGIVDDLHQVIPALIEELKRVS